MPDCVSSRDLVTSMSISRGLSPQSSDTTVYVHHIDDALLPLAELLSPTANPSIFSSEVDTVSLHVLKSSFSDHSMARDTPPHDTVAREEHLCEPFEATVTASGLESEESLECSKTQAREIEQEWRIEPFESRESYRSSSDDQLTDDIRRSMLDKRANPACVVSVHDPAIACLVESRN